MARGLAALLRTLMCSLPALGNVGSVLFLFMFVYGVVGMTLFGSVRPGAYIGADANFSNMGRALLTLFRMMTGESWDGAPARRAHTQRRGFRLSGKERKCLWAQKSGCWRATRPAAA